MRYLGRRPFLTLGLAALGSGALVWGGSAAVCAAPTRLWSKALLDAAGPTLARLHDITRVGHAWRAEEGLEAILAALEADEALGRVLLLPGPDDAETIAERVREDYRRGDIVYLSGWLVARTEARLAALIL